jgi:sulfur-carrier protein adenylyltransferase/sulfurtransferase
MPENRTTELLRQLRLDIAEIAPTAALSDMKLGARLLDVRSEAEYSNGTAVGALCLPRSHLELQIETQVPDLATPLRVMCASGQRSLLAAANLRALGYQDVASIAGGFTAWKAAGLPVDLPAALNFDPQRFARQLILPNFGAQAQNLLASAKVLLIGAGGLGSPAALYLAAAGVGRLGISDDDTVDISNLQRQILHRTDRVGMAKTLSAELTLRALNPACKIDRLPRICAENSHALLQNYDLVIDGSDNFETRFLLADICLAQHKPLVYGAVLRFSGQVSVFCGHESHLPCYRCLFAAPPPPEAAPNCTEAGVLGVVPGLIGTLQASEAIKLITGIGTPLLGRLLLVDMLSASFRELRLPKDPNCPGCGPNPDASRSQHYNAAGCAVG